MSAAAPRPSPAGERQSGTCAAPAAPALELIEVTVPRATDADAPAIEGVNWSVRAGEFWVVTGLHASGKTDLLHCAAGLTTPLAGECRLFGKKLPLAGDADLPTRLRLGLVFDGGNLLDHLNLAANVALPLRYHRDLTEEEAAPQVQPLLAALQLESAAHRSPDALSRNLRRRAGLARALVMAPDLLLLDNPLTGLDARQAAWWLETLGRLARGDTELTPQPMTLAVTAESPWPWRRLGTRFALAHDRRLVDLGGRREVAQSTHPVIREMLAAARTASED